MVNKTIFTCDFCGQHFKTEKGFFRHKCKQMKREEDFKSIEGQAAFAYYRKWIALKHHNKNASPSAFKTSAYFVSFVKFYELVRITQIPSTDIYIKLMVRKKIEPKLWYLEASYHIYLEYITYQLSLDQIYEITIKTLLDCASAAEVNTSKVFDILTVNDVIQLFRQRRLSPWVLLKSQKFAKFVKFRATPEERTILSAIIKPDHWAKKYKKNPKQTKIVKNRLSEMGL